MLSMGHEIDWLARYEGLKVVLRTINFNLTREFCNAHLLSLGIGLRSGFVLGIFMKM